MSANEKQVAGNHYKTMTPDIPQHWDIVALHNLDYFQGQITKYVMRWKNKNGLQDLEKALHFLEKYIELNSPKQESVPDHLKEFVPTERQKEVAAKFEDLRLKNEEALSPMLVKFLKDSGEPLPQGYVNQDGKLV
jgi:hypothetical protein